MHYILYAMDQYLESYCFDCEDRALNKVEWDEVEDFISEIPKTARVSVIVDSISEDTVLEDMPVLLPWEKHALQQRLHNKFLSKGAICHQITWTGIRNKNSDTRKEELVISNVLYPSKAIDRLISSIVTARLIWSGFYSSSILFQNLLNTEIKKTAKLNASQLKKSPILMVIKVSESHYRQCFFYQGYLRMTRIVEVDNQNNQYSDDNERLSQAISETRLAVRFIYNQKMLPFNEPINFVLIDQVAEQREEYLLDQFKKSGVISAKWSQDKNFFVLARPQDFIRISLTDHSEYNASQVLAEKVNRGFVKNFYELPYVKMVRGFKASGYLFSALAVVAVSASLFIGINALLQSDFLKNKITVLGQAEQELVNQRKSFVDILKGYESPADIKATVNFYHALDRLIQDYPYGYDFNALGLLLSQHSLVHIQSINWAPQTAIDPPSVKVTMQAAVGPFDGRFVNLTQAINDFEQALKLMPGVSNVNIMRRPFDEDVTRAYRVPNLQPDTRVQINVEWEQRRQIKLENTTRPNEGMR
ncbi:hypothetical protein JX580_03905 [Thiomicrospira microaerophila]|uniref:hypothetical protein n=1 Tax=Thiomicrospira microaerophila TaxID=406020 RepID=UPI00201079AB|nr:hypothetical protein [Thiomicrospira microaerophila]UQB43035.1 hypothetical protein JX580_03905 [Thiomicrospira microaerophila]